MTEFFTVIFGQWKKILLITVLTTLAATALGIMMTKTTYSATLFINIGAIRDMVSGIPENPYDTLQAADMFSESVQGWFKNPSFLEEIRAKSGTGTDLSVRKQEKQNLLVTFKTDSPDNAENVSATVKEVLETRISAYNVTNSGNFTLSVFDTDISETHLPLWIFPVLGFLAGTFSGYFLVLIWMITAREYGNYRHGKT